MVKQKYFKEVNERLWGGQKYTKYNKINNNSENFRGATLLPRVISPPGPNFRACLRAKPHPLEAMNNWA